MDEAHVAEVPGDPGKPREEDWVEGQHHSQSPAHQGGSASEQSNHRAVSRASFEKTSQSNIGSAKLTLTPCPGVCTGRHCRATNRLLYYPGVRWYRCCTPKKA